MLTLYDHNESVCCQKVRLALAEKQVPFHSVHIAIEKGEQFSDKFLRINPAAVVPVATHNDKVITESTIISEYINDAFDGPALMPLDPYWRARKRAWSMLLDTSIHLRHVGTLSFVIAFRFLFLETLDTPEKLADFLNNVRDPDDRERQRQSFQLGYDDPAFVTAVIAFDKMLANMEQQLTETLWLAGDSLSLADLDIAPYVHRLASLRLDHMWDDYPNVGSWYQRMRERASWNQAITQQHLEKWVNIMANTGLQARPHVERILDTGRT